MGVVLEIASAAIICTSFAGEADLAGCPVVTLLHLGIETGQFFKQGAFQCLFSHPTRVYALQSKGGRDRMNARKNS